MPLSDHALLLFRTTVKRTTINCLSWNIMAHNVSCNDVGVNDTALDSTHRQEAHRYAQISQFLAKQAAEHESHVITLQEVTHTAIRPHLESHFPKESWWHIEPNPIPTVGLVSVVSKKHFSLVSHTYNPTFRTQSFSLLSASTKEDVHIHNVWTPYSFTPIGHENYYRTLLRPDSILLGDTNSRVLPKPNPLKPNTLIATGVIPPIFKASYKKREACDLILDHSDGAFIAQGETIQQLPYQQLTAIEDLIGSSTLSPYHQHYYRPILTLDPEYSALKTKAPYSTFFSLIQQLNACQKGMDLQPLLTANPQGVIGVGLGFSPEHTLYHEMKQAPALQHEGIYDWGSQQTLDKDQALCFLTISPECIAHVERYLNDKIKKPSVSNVPFSLFYTPTEDASNPIVPSKKIN